MQQQQRRYSFEGEEHLYGQRPPPQEYNNQYQPQQPYQHQSPPHSPPLSPSAHPDSSFNRLRAARRYSRERDPSSQPLQGYGQPISPGQVPLQAAQALPPHRDAEGRFWGRELGYTNSVSQHSNVSPGADNFGEQAAGGIAGIAMGVADTHARESGLEAMRNTPGYDPRMEMNDRS